MMLIGRFFFASGFFGNVVVSLEVMSHWFWGKELALAFAVYLSASRLATVVSFASIGAIAEQVGLQSTLWITYAVGLLGPTSAVAAGWVYRKYGSVGLKTTTLCGRDGPGKFSFHQIKLLGRDFWILCGIIFFYFAVLFTFIIDGPKFIIVSEFLGVRADGGFC